MQSTLGVKSLQLVQGKKVWLIKEYQICIYIGFFFVKYHLFSKKGNYTQITNCAC